jgi:DNA polymerase-3 subunit gamma/tau
MDGLARKYRPTNIGEYMGEGIRELVKRRFADPTNYPNVVLLHGTHGCGKTSCARLLAMEYLCENKEDGHACGHCEMCQELLNTLIHSETGVESFAEVREIDIASEGNKGNIDEIINSSLQEPVMSKYKILIMDEFHMANKQVQNRLLKIMEEPPKHLVFILCTTNPEAIIDTIHSRCQFKVEVKKAKLDELVNRMLYICQQEGIATSKAALRLIAQKNDRIPRDSLMTLEQVAKDCGNQVTLQNVSDTLVEVANDVYVEYFKCANKSLEEVMLFLNKLKEDDLSPVKFIKGLMQFTIDCVNILYGISLEEYPKEYISIVGELMGMYSNQDLDYLLQIIEYASKSMNDGDERAYLTIVTTAMRISKLKYLEDLKNTDIETARDNKRAKKNRSQVVKEDTKKSAKTTTDTLGLSVVSDVFGKGITEMIPTDEKTPYVPFKDEEEKEEDDTISDSDLDDLLSDMLK